jgi:hypothetical protein
MSQPVTKPGTARVKEKTFNKTAKGSEKKVKVYLPSLMMKVPDHLYV